MKKAVFLGIVFSVLMASAAYAPLIVDHSKHDPKFCVTPTVIVLSPQHYQEVSGAVSISATIDKPLKPIEDYELEVYIDHKLVYKSWIAQGPYSWDSNTVGDGKHIIEISSCDRENHVGYAQVSVRVKNHIEPTSTSSSTTTTNTTSTLDSSTDTLSTSK